MVKIEQISALLDYLENHQELAFGNCSRTNEGRDMCKRYWMECAQILNSVSVDGPDKTPAEWRTFYNEYKCKLIKKIKLQKSEISATDGGFAKKITLTPLQERLYTILGRDGGTPLPRVRHKSLTNQQGPTHFVPVEQDRDKRISKPSLQCAELRLEKPTVKDKMNIIKQSEHKTEEKDEYTTYGELVAMKLKKIDNVYARSTAQYHINNILYRAEIGEFDKPRKGKNSYSSKEHFTAENSYANVDLNDDAVSSRSSSPTKSKDYNLKLEESDDDIS